jgi:TonB family protein
VTTLARESALAAAVGALVVAFAAPVHRSDQLPPVESMTVVRAKPGPPAFRAEPPPVRLHAGMPLPKKIVDVAPVYPLRARAARVHGAVILDIVVDAEGRVQNVEVVRSIPLLDQAAIDAVRQWRFAPSRTNGTPTAVMMTVTVTFELRDR